MARSRRGGCSRRRRPRSCGCDRWRAAESYDILERAAPSGGGAQDLEHDQVTRDPPALGCFGRRGARDVVGDQHHLCRNALGIQSLRCLAEVEHVPGIVAEGEYHSVATVRRFGDGVCLLR